MKKKTATIITIVLSFICAGLEFLCMSEIIYYVHTDDISKINLVKILMGIITFLAVLRFISGYMFNRIQESDSMLSKIIGGIMGLPIIATSCFASGVDFWLTDKIILSAPVAVIIIAVIISWVITFLVVIYGINSIFWGIDKIRELAVTKRNTKI